uniref:ARAD1A00154p n=1 Tax=Blastobotrys adeninivorans TaxID=409370 RepID=A0A060SWW1_BLAAD
MSKLTDIDRFTSYSTDRETYSELWIGDIRDYKAALRLDREEYPGVLVFEYDSENTRNYLFEVDFSDKRPNWQLLTRDAILLCYSIICGGGEFAKIDFPGIAVVRSKTRLGGFH